MENTPEQNAEGIALVAVLAQVLDRLVQANGPIALQDPGQVTKFHAMKAPAIAIQQYLERIHKYASCSNECFILALIYIDRLIQRSNFLLTSLNVHRVVITAMLLAAKFFDDAYYNNAYYAKVGGVLLSEMNGLEVDFLFRINFSLHVASDVFSKYRAELLANSVYSTTTMPIPPQQAMMATPVVDARYVSCDTYAHVPDHLHHEQYYGNHNNDHNHLQQTDMAYLQHLYHLQMQQHQQQQHHHQQQYFARCSQQPSEQGIAENSFFGAAPNASSDGLRMLAGAGL